LRLTDEPRTRFFAGAIIAQDLDRDVFIEHEMTRSHHDAHSTLAENIFDAIFVEQDGAVRDVSQWSARPHPL